MPLNASVIDIGELRRADEFPSYAAICADVDANPFVLSPSAMAWEPRVSLNRLVDCSRFWLAQKKKLRCKLTELFEPVLRYHYGDEFLAVFGRHPWQCLLYLEYQRRQGGRGLYLLQSPLDRNIYRKLDWDAWFAPQARLAEHWLALSLAGFVPENFRSRQAQMRRFVERIGVEHPADMTRADMQSITRRFGRWLGQIWQWSFQQTDALNRFPWRRLETAAPPVVDRDLEYPVNQWEYIAVLLREDLERLAGQMPRDECTHVNRLDWQVDLFNGSELRLALSFRHPYALHRDAPDFDTALYQARYLFEDVMRQLSQRDQDLDLPEVMPFVAWRIGVGESILLAPLLWDLFAPERDAIDYRRILDLQNKLPIAFESYRACPSFFPEDSFSCASPGIAPQAGLDPSFWASSAINKPLFHYRELVPIPVPERFQRIFLERNSNQWWLSGDALQSIRDYYILRDGRGRCSWVFRDANGAWFKQGEFC